MTTHVHRLPSGWVWVGAFIFMLATWNFWVAWQTWEPTRLVLKEAVGK